ncbi:TPA: hypothetical protein DDW35_01745 [Candidatus Sumerlaeota bacterium]|nr:hypothetical protein [Candidatus Sumerlaeota bacterium]
MSYDLYFRSAPGKPEFSHTDFLGYFKNKAHYKLSKTQAWYNNENTGVYFSFDYEGKTSPDDEVDDELGPVIFNMNYARPHVFANEAAIEIKEFIETFGLGILDTQIDGMNETYSTPGFMQGWNQGNMMGIAAFAGKGSQGAPLTLPHADLERYWRWNRLRDSLQKKVGDGVFVPRVSFCQDQGQVKSFVVWTDGIPILIPKVDAVVLVRKNIPSFISRSVPSEPVISLVSYKQVEPFLDAKELATALDVPYKCSKPLVSCQP